MENHKDYIHALVESGLSIIPITEGKKTPHFSCLKKDPVDAKFKHDLLERRASPQEIEKYVAAGAISWAIAGGDPSGNLVTLDFDEKHYPGLYDLWYSKLSNDQKKIVDSFHKNSTRNNGIHLHYRTQNPQSTIKLARKVEYNKITQKEEIVTIAETKAARGYALIPPSDGYTTLQGDLLNLPIIPDEIHEELIDILRTFNEVEDEPPTKYERQPTDTIPGDRPGDKFNQLATWEEILEPHGWVQESKNYWRRPGKKEGDGISATTNHAGIPMFYIFSTSASPFQANKGYSKFNTFALLNHRGDFKTAARAIVETYLPVVNLNNQKQSTNQGAIQSKRKAVLTCFSDIQPEKIEWLWPGKIALGKLTIISGDPGLGKSLLSTGIAANVSRGFPWPIDKTSAPLGDVILLSAEDDPADTIRPRLDAAKADCSRIHILKAIEEIDSLGQKIQSTFSFRRDIKTLEEMIETLPKCKLIIIDPVSAYLDGTDGNSNSDIRGLLAPLSELAGKYKVAVLLVSHLNKGGNGGSAIYRTMGSLAFTAAVRAAYIVTKDADNPERRLWMPVKNNISKDYSGLAYTVVEAENGTAMLMWESNPVTMTADEALTSTKSNDEKTEIDWAIEFLNDILCQGPVDTVKAFAEAKKMKISDKTLQRAVKKIGVKTKKKGFRDGWEWSLPSIEDAEGTHPIGEGILVDDGHLRAI